MSWGIVLPDTGLELSRLPQLAGELEATGYRSLWAGEVSGTDAVTTLALAGTGTQCIGLGTSVLPIFTRAPGVLAMTLSSLARAFPSRFAGGLGASSAVVVERWNGLRYERLLARMRDTLRFLREALAGGRVDRDFGTFSIRGFRLTAVPREPPRLLVAAAAPRMLELAKEEADGVILNWCSSEDLDRLESLPKERSRVAAFVYVCPTPDRARAHALARPLVAQYLAVPGYAAQQRRLGRARQLEPLWRAWARGDRRRAIEKLPEAVLDELVIHGAPAACRERLAAFALRSGALPLAHVIADGTPFVDTALSLGPASNDSDGPGLAG